MGPRSSDIKFLVSVMTIVAMLAPNIALAENRYWRGGATSNSWNNTFNWANNMTDGPSGASVPGVNDIVIFSKNRGLTGGVASGNLVVIRENIQIAGLILSPTFSGSVFTGTSSIIIGSRSGGLRIGSGRLQIGTGTVFSCSGSLTMSGGILSNSKKNNNMRLSGSLLHRGGALSYSGTIIFNNNNADQTLRTTSNETVSATYKYAKATLSGVTLNNTAGTTVDDLLITGALLRLNGLTVTRGNFDLARYGVNLALSGSMDIASNAQAGFNASTQTLTLSGSIQRGSSGYFNLSGGTLVMNGGTGKRQAIAANNTKVASLTVTKTSSGILVDNLTVLGAVTINTGSLLAFGAQSLYATGSSIVNYGNIKEDTGKLSHTGSSFVVGNSSYARQQLFYNGNTVYFTLTDADENIVGSTADTVTITVTLVNGGTTRDTETVTLTETAKENGIFRGSIATANATSSSQDGTLQYTADGDISALYTDAQDGRTNADGGIFQVTGGSSTAGSGGGSGGGGGGRRVGASAPVQTPKKTPPPVRRDLKTTTKKATVKEEAKKKETVKKVLKTKAQIRADARKKASQKKRK